MKFIAIVLIALGLFVVFFPSFYTCQAHGHAIQLTAGVSIPMKCLWTAHAEIALGVLLLAVGTFLFISRKSEAKRFLSILAVILGIFIFLLPASLIGVCINPDMLCMVIMKPALLLAGVLTFALGITATALSFMRKTESK